MQLLFKNKYKNKKVLSGMLYSDIKSFIIDGEMEAGSAVYIYGEY